MKFGINPTSDAYGSEFYRTDHFTASFEPSSKYPAEISIASVANDVTAPDRSIDELQHWNWFTYIVLRVLENSFGTIDFETLSARMPNSSDQHARSLPAVLALRVPNDPAINFNKRLFWLYHRPKNRNGSYPPLPKDIVKRVVADLRRETYLVVHSLNPTLD